MTCVTILASGPGVTLQDLGWQGTLALGLSQGGVADRRAYAEAAALLGVAQDGSLGGVLEMAGFGLRLKADAPTRVALTGARMRAALDGAPLLWNAVHRIDTGQVLDIGAAEQGIYGYLAFGGGIDHAPVLGACSTHRAANLGWIAKPGAELHLRCDPRPERTGLHLPIAPLASAAASTPVRIVPTAQTGLFPQTLLSALEQTPFQRGQRGNRQGVALDSAQDFSLPGGQSLVSETVIPGDIQVPGDGTPVVLLADCQTTGGYPRIASVLPCDVPRVAQAVPGTQLRFTWLDLEGAIAAERAEHRARSALGRACVPILRDPAHLHDLLSYQLISGMISGSDPDPADEKGA